MPDKPKTISCRLSAADYERLQDHADALALAQSEYLRCLIRIPVEGEGLAAGERCVVIDAKTVGRIYHELVRWGRHYNQAVRALNTIALHLRRGGVDAELFAEQIALANERLETCETGRAEVLAEMRRLETCTLIGG